MKHSLRLVSLTVVTLTLVMAMALCFHVPSPTDPPTPAPFDLQTAFATLAGVAILVTTLTESLTKVLARSAKIVLNGWPARAASWIIASILVAVGIAGNVGIFADPVFLKWPLWVTSIGGGIVIGLMSNGIFTADVVQLILGFLKVRVPVTPPDSPPKS
jgi:hypothetical protein